MSIEIKVVIGLVIPVYNNAAITKQCVNSIIENLSKNPNCLIIIVDDGSDEATKKMLASMQVDIHVLTNEVNLGYLEATNKGIAYGIETLKCSHIALMNNDLILSEDWLSALLKESQHFDLIGYFSHECQSPTFLEKVNFIEFSCVLISKRVFDKIGLLDNRFLQGYYSDDDFCLRACLQNFSLAIIKNNNRVVHLCGETFGKVTRKSLIADMRKIFDDKWKPKSDLPQVKHYLKNVAYDPELEFYNIGIFKKAINKIKSFIS